MLNIEQIQEILPQRYPFLMIDRVIELEPGKKVVALKNVSFNEEFFSGHFPGKPIMPGALIIEAMAQASIVLFFSGKSGSSAKAKSYYLGAVKMRFLQPVLPGDQLVITVEPLKMLSNIGIVSAQASVNAKVVARGEISLSAKENG
jgi:3-hydroxyacyl-[acyl-carrier-protein] dehydratase